MNRLELRTDVMLGDPSPDNRSNELYCVRSGPEAGRWYYWYCRTEKAALARRDNYEEGNKWRREHGRPLFVVEVFKLKSVEWEPVS